MTTYRIFIATRVSQELVDKINTQMAIERRDNRSEMIRILIEDGLKARALSSEPQTEKEQ